MKEDQNILPGGELYDFVYRSVFTSVIAVFAFLEIFNSVNTELITGGKVFTVIVISFSLNALLLLYRKVKLYMIPAVAVVGLIMYLSIDREDILAILESTIFSILLIGCASFVLFIICDRFLILNVILSIGVIAYLLSELFMGFYVYKASPALGIFYVLAVVTRLVRDGFGTPDPDRMRKYITFLLPFMLGFMLMLVIIPKPEEPISWEWVRRIYEYTSERFSEAIHRLTTRYGRLDSEYFTISFGMNRKMTYDNSDKDRDELFEITSGGTMIPTLYLKGEIFNEFRDGEWYNTLETEENYYRTDAAETRYGIEQYGEVPAYDLMRETSVRIRYLDIVSPIVFAPSKITSYSDVSAGRKTIPAGEHLLFSGNASRGSEYNVSFIMLNIGNSVFRDYMNSPSGQNGASTDSFSEYRRYIEENYTSSPEIRESVKEWIAKVTEGAETDYDRLLAVEEALSKYEYDLNTSDLPGYVRSEGDFINYFLLEKREGYCVHYATAFCLLARYMGYPSRVVQGFKTEQSASSHTIVRDGCGHTWPEVYFEGRGWIPFEPTPGMGKDRYTGWEVKNGNTQKYDQPAGENRMDELTVPEEDEEYLSQHSESMISGILILAILGVIILSLTLLISVRFLVRRAKLKKMNDQERFRHEYDNVSRILTELGARRAPDETLAEFGDRIGIEEYIICTGIYEECLYGSRVPSGNDTAGLEACRVKLYELMKETYGKTYLLHRLKLMLQ